MNSTVFNFKQMKKNFLSITILLCFICGLYAQSNLDSISLNEIEISASRVKLYSGSARILTVIEKTEIDQSAVRSLDDLLDYVAGIDVRQRGVNGVQADVSIHGGSFDQILVLLNGMNITDPQTGHYNLDIPLDISDVSRIEILQGSAARILGPNAFSGAINIITGENNKNKLSVRNSSGSFGYLAQNITGNINSEHFQSFASAAHKKSDGYIQNTDFEIYSAFWQSKLRTSTYGNFDLQIAAQTKSYGANSFYSAKYPNQFEQTKTFLTSLGWMYEKHNWKTTAQIYWRQHHDRFELFRNFEGAIEYPWYKDHNYHQTDVTGGKLSFINHSIAGTTTIGLDLRNEHIYSNVLGKTIKIPIDVPFEKNQIFTREDNRLLSTFWIDHSIKIQKFYASAGAALTYNKQYGKHLNGGLDVAYNISDLTTLYASANSALRLPTFTDLYYQSATQISNPNLKPEKSVTFELGSKFNSHRWAVNADAFYRFGKDIIDWVKMPEAEKWESRNWTSVKAYGVDLNGEYKFQTSFLNSVKLSYSFLNLDKQAGNLDSKYALDYLRHKLIFALDHSVFSKFIVRWNASFFDRTGDYIDFTTNKKANFKPYLLLDTKVLWASNNVTLFAELNNILNKKYADYGGLEQPGTNFNAGIQLSVF